MNKIELIGEIASHHCGSFNNFKELICGLEGVADSVKFQIIRADELCARESTRYSVFQNLEFDLLEWKSLAKIAKQKSLFIWADIFGIESLEIAVDMGVKKFKLQSSELFNASLHAALAAHSTNVSEVMFSVAGWNLSQIQCLLDKISDYEFEKSLAFGLQSFPADMFDVSLRQFEQLRRLTENLNVKLCLNDHCDGSSPESVWIPQFYAAYGIDKIEKHFSVFHGRLDFNQMFDWQSAVPVNRLMEIAQFVRFTNGFKLGRENRSNEELTEYSRWSKKSMISNDELAKGDLLRPSSCSWLRTDQYGNQDLCSLQKAGRIIRRDISSGSTLKRADIEPRLGLILYARSSSSRLPNKIFRVLANGNRILDEMVTTALSFGVPFLFATSNDSSDDQLAAEVESLGVTVVRGDLLNVAERLSKAAELLGDVDYIIRLPGDNFFKLPSVISILQNEIVVGEDLIFCDAGVKGLELELINPCALKVISRLAIDPAKTEYLSWYFESEEFAVTSLKLPEQKESRRFSLYCDTEQDFQNVDRFVSVCPEWRKLSISEFVVAVNAVELSADEERPLDTSVKSFDKSTYSII